MCYLFTSARDEGRGKAAIAELEKENLHPKFHQLDITDHESIVRLRDFLQQNYGGLDILVNNAAIAYEFNVSILLRLINLTSGNFNPLCDSIDCFLKLAPGNFNPLCVCRWLFIKARTENFNPLCDSP